MNINTINSKSINISEVNPNLNVNEIKDLMNSSKANDSLKDSTIINDESISIQNEIKIKKSRSNIVAKYEAVNVSSDEENVNQRTKGQKILKSFKKNKINIKPKISLNEFATKEKKQISNEVREIFKAETKTIHNIKSLNKERKVNDTIVAISSLFMIILSFYQLYILISTEYQSNSMVLTIRTCILILSIPNGKIKNKKSNIYI